MKKITIKDAIGNTKYKCDIGIDENALVEIAFPSDKTEPDSLVFYTEKKREKTISISFGMHKPYAALVNEDCNVIYSDTPLIKTNSVRSALSYAYSNKYEIDYTKMKIIGVTGTNGKTTTATLIYEILKRSGYSVGFIGTGKILINEDRLSDENYSMTTPDPELLYDVLAKMQKRKCDYVVMEVSSHSLALNKTDPIRFEYAIFTNLSKEHMDFHDTMDEYYKSKLSLFSNAKKGLFNMDDAYSRRAFNEVKCEKSSIGILYDADAYATDIECTNLSESAFYYRAQNLIFRVRTRLAGAFNVYNVLCALKCVIDIGVSPCIAKSHLESIHSIDGRMEVIESDITVIIDYAHTAFAFENCLKSLFLANNHRQNISVVFGCGGNRDKTKRAPMGKAASEYTKKIIITEDNNRDEDFSDIVADIAKGISDGVYRVIKDRETAIRTAIYEADAGDIVAIVGKGHERYKIENGKYTPFNERSIVADAIEIRSKGYAH